MNLQKLFTAQAELDAYIEQQHPVAEGENRLEKKVLALLVELSECAQESRCFKFWSNDQSARTEQTCEFCEGKGYKRYFNMQNGGHRKVKCSKCDGTGTTGNPLLEEYVDCLHFILSIGNDLGIDAEHEKVKKYVHLQELSHCTVTDLFTSAFQEFSKLATLKGLINQDDYIFGFVRFLNIGANIGFTFEQIESAYWAKYEINKQRQVDGY